MIFSLYLFVSIAMFFLGLEYGRYKYESRFLDEKRGYESKILQLQDEQRSLEAKLKEARHLLINGR